MEVRNKVITLVLMLEVDVLTNSTEVVSPVEWSSRLDSRKNTNCGLAFGNCTLIENLANMNCPNVIVPFHEFPVD